MSDTPKPATDLDTLRNRVKATLAANGAMLGKELCAVHPEVSYLAMWQACFSDLDIQISHFSRYYLRFDIARDDHVRLSPSILRDFLSFTLLSLPGQRDTIIDRQVELSNFHREVSLGKIRIASRILTSVLKHIPQAERRRFCAFIAGDLTYFLGHTEPREVKSVGEMVRGSDIDIIIVHDGLEAALVEAIDGEMMRAKAFYLRHPQHRQEVDYICKSLDKMFGQFGYGDIHDKIASKIAYESLFLAGSAELYGAIQDELELSGAKALIEADFEHGLKERKRAMHTLLAADPDRIDAEIESLFFFSQERVEFQ